MRPTTNVRIVIGYDGSDEARRAVCFAAQSLQVESAVIAHVFSDPTAVAVTGPVGAVPPPIAPQQREEIERHARCVAEEGAALAGREGLNASVVVRSGRGPGDIAHVLLDLADSCEADMIVVGHRHSSRLQTALLGSVSITAVHDERRPVLVVPA
jgi:nucleotide-binding universal stress UspA family protein